MRKRTAQLIEEHKAALSTEPTGKKRGIGRGNHPNSRKGDANLKPFPAGVSGNPGGLPGTDLAALAARRLFEAAGEGGLPEIPKGFNAYAFSVLADRGYGKVKDKQQVEITGPGGKALSITVKLIKGNGDSKPKS